MQSRDDYKLISLPKLYPSPICPVTAMRAVFQLYDPSAFQPLFQTTTSSGLQVIIVSKVRQILARINLHMKLPSNFYTFHSFRRSGATLAYRAQVPVQDIKDHGTWESDCVWKYIHLDREPGQKVAQTFKCILKGVR